MKAAMMLGRNHSCMCSAVPLHNIYCCMLPWPKADLHLEADPGCEMDLETSGYHEKSYIVIYVYISYVEEQK